MRRRPACCRVGVFEILSWRGRVYEQAGSEGALMREAVDTRCLLQATESGCRKFDEIRLLVSRRRVAGRRPTLGPAALVAVDQRHYFRQAFPTQQAAQAVAGKAPSSIHWPLHPLSISLPPHSLKFDDAYISSKTLSDQKTLWSCTSYLH